MKKYRLYVFRGATPPDQHESDDLDGLIAKAERLNAAGLLTGWEIYDMERGGLIAQS